MIWLGKIKSSFQLFQYVVWDSRCYFYAGMQRTQMWRHNILAKMDTLEHTAEPHFHHPQLEISLFSHPQHLKRCWQLLCNPGHPVINITLPRIVASSSHQHSYLNNTGKLGWGHPVGEGERAAFASGHTHSSNDVLKIHPWLCLPGKYLCQHHMIRVDATLEALVL